MAILSTAMKSFVKINGKQHYLQRAVAREGEVIDVNLQARRDAVRGLRSRL